jgi:hypothetical protein
MSSMPEDTVAGNRAWGRGYTLARVLRKDKGLPGRWIIAVRPNAWLPTIKSETAVGKLDLSLSDILEDLDMVLMLSVVADKEDSHWGLVGDLVYLNLEDDPIEMQTTILTAFAAYRPWKDQEHKLLAGARYWDVDVTAGSFGGGADWVDPVIGASTLYTVNENLFAKFLVDGGVFSIGEAADYTWQGIFTLNYRLNKHFYAAAGYRYLRVDQDTATEFDTKIYGPILGLWIAL